MPEYPWNASREEMEEFERTVPESWCALPDDLTADELAELFERNLPREFFAETVLSEVLYHPNCPPSVLLRAYRMFLRRRHDVDGLLMRLATRKELSTMKIGWLADRFLGEILSEYAIEVLARRVDDSDHCRSILRNLHDNLPRKCDLDRRDYIASVLAASSKRREVSGKKGESEGKYEDGRAGADDLTGSRMNCGAYRELDLTRGAVKYIDYRFEMADAIGKLACRDLDLGGGSVITFLPDEIDAMEAAESFTGGHVALPSCTLDWLVTCFQEHLRRSANSAVLVAAAIPEAGYSFCDCEEGRILTCQRDVFYLFHGGNVDRRAVAEAVEDAESGSRFFAYMLSACELEPPSAEPTELSASDIEALTGAIEAIALGSFHGEGYLVWSKERRAARKGSITYVATGSTTYDGLDGAERAKDTLFGSED